MSPQFFKFAMSILFVIFQTGSICLTSPTITACFASAKVAMPTSGATCPASSTIKRSMKSKSGRESKMLLPSSPFLKKT